MHEGRHDPLWDSLEGLRSSAVVAETRAYVDDLTRRREERRRLFGKLLLPVGGALASGLATLAIIAFIPSQQPQAQRFDSPVGIMRIVRLDDGSVVSLNTDTSVRIVYGRNGRDVDLLRGEARFDVAHDAERPFRVTVGPMSVVALGTAFDVSALPSRTAVTLIRGRVQVDAKSQGDRETLAPGEQVTLAEDGGLTPKRRVDVESVMAWQKAQIDLNDLSLDNALAEVNRYSRRKIVVRAPGLMEERVSGVFRTGDVDAVAAALSAYFPLKETRRTDDMILLERVGG